MHMKFLLFDFDGVIVNTLVPAFEIMKRMKAGDLTEEEYRNWFNGNVYEKMDKVEAHPGNRIEQVTPFFQEFIPKLLALRPIDGMIDLIQKLHVLGYRMVIISSTMDEAINRFLELHKIRDCFDAIYGASVSKDKVEKMKRALDEYSALPADALFITDTLGDLRDAKNVGVPSIAVTWGYHPMATLQQGESIAIVQSSMELERAIIQV